jgi:hypothetical protein
MDKKDIIKHIFTIIIIVIISFIVWNNNPSQAGAQIAASFNNRDIFVTFDGFDLLTNTEDDDYYTLKPANLSLRNTTNKDKEYKLYYTISKTSTVTYDTLKISLDDQVYDLKDMDYIEDDTYMYFMVKHDYLSSYTNINIPVRVWTSSTNGKLTSSFITR